MIPNYHLASDLGLGRRWVAIPDLWVRFAVLESSCHSGSMVMVEVVLAALVVEVVVVVVEVLLVVLEVGCYFVVVQPMMVGYFVVVVQELADCFVVGVVLSLVPRFEDQ